MDYDKALDRSAANIHWLADNRIACLIADSIKYRDKLEYDLAAFCIMPNHVHIVVGIGKHDLFGPIRQTDSLSDKSIGQVGQIANLSNKPFSKIMQSLKRFTASGANDILQRSGSFWQDESYDHIVRDEKEFERIVRYVVYNPVKAGLVKNWRDWKWTCSLFDID